MKKILPIKINGFTLIEVMVVIGIAGLLIATAIASYGKMNDRARVEHAARKIASEIKSLQKQVDSGKSNCAAGQVFGGIQISFAEASRLSFQSICNGSPTEPVGYAPSPSLAEGLIINNFNPVNILPLGRGFSDQPTIEVRNNNNSIIYRVNLTRAGGVSVDKKP